MGFHSELVNNDLVSNRAQSINWTGLDNYLASNKAQSIISVQV